MQNLTTLSLNLNYCSPEFSEKSLNFKYLGKAFSNLINLKHFHFKITSLKDNLSVGREIYTLISVIFQNISLLDALCLKIIVTKPLFAC